MRQSLPQKYIAPFAVILSIFFFSSCEKKFDSVIDPAQNAPVVMDASSSMSIVNTDTINIGNSRTPDDLLTIRGVASIRAFHPHGKKEISTVKYSVVMDQSVIGEGLFHDDGILPDRILNDSIYSGYVEFQIRRFQIGKLTLSLWSENYSGDLSNTALLPLSIIRLNHPPVISNLIAPTTINLAETDSFKISLKVIDPDGQSDIKYVTRITPSGKILLLHAANGSQNDSIYVETVGLINPRPDVGSYLFHFRAVDRSNDSSNVLMQTIVIVNNAVTE